MENNTLKSVSIRRQNNDKSKERNRKWCKQYYENNKERLQSWEKIDTENYLKRQKKEIVHWSVFEENTQKLSEYSKSKYSRVSQKDRKNT